MRSLTRHILRTALPLLPAGLAIGFIWLSFGRTITDFMPHYDVDQYPYWREMATFAQVGFSGGYYGVNEMPSVLKGFGPHGIGIVLVYGSLYRLMPGLEFAAVPVFNVALLTAALLAYAWILRPNLRELLVACLAVTLFPPVFLYLPTSFQDGFQYAMAVLLAMAFIKMAQMDEEPRGRSQLFIGVFLLTACFIRYTWALCFIPYFYMLLSGKRHRLLLALLLTAVVSVLVVKAFNLFIPGWYLSPEAGVHTAGVSLGDKAAFLLDRSRANLASLTDYRNNRAAAAVLSGMVLFTIGWCAATLVSWTQKRSQRDGALFLALFANLVMLPCVFIISWTGSGSHMVRLLSANYLFCFLLTTHFFSKRVASLFVTYFAMLLPMYMTIFQIYHLPGFLNEEARGKVKSVFALVEPHARAMASGGPWDKTLYLRIDANGVAFLGLPPSLGIQTAVGDAPFPPRLSRFALIDAPPAHSAARWVFLDKSEVGTLFVRADADSGGDHPGTGETKP